MPFKMALFGAGKWARNIARALTERGDVHIEAALVRDPSKPRDWLHGTPVYTDPSALLRKHACDGAVICTPPATHSDFCITALEHGLPCFLEKPATLSLAEMKRIETAAMRAGLPVVVDYIHLHSVPFQRLVEETQRRGRPVKVIALAGNKEAAVRDCSILWDWGAHDIAMAVACLGGVGAVPHQVDAWPAHTAAFDSIRLRLDWAGIPVHFRFSQELPRKARAFCVQFQEEVFLYTDRPVHTLTRWPRGAAGRYRKASGEVLVQGGVNPLHAALDSFINKARKRAVVRDDLSSSVEVTRILELCDRQLAI